MSEYINRVYQSEDVDDLATALALAQSEMKHAAKANTNPFFKSKYSALPDVMDAARPYLSKNGLAVTQITDFDDTRVFVVTQLTHKSGQWMRSWYPVNPVKNDPQGLGSALTYARRYSYASIAGVAASDEDDDGNAGSGKISATNGEKTAGEIYGSSAAWGRAMDKLEKDWSETATLAELDKVTKENKIHLEAVQQIDPECHADMQKKYQAHKTRIQQDKMVKQQLGE